MSRIFDRAFESEPIAIVALVCATIYYSVYLLLKFKDPKRVNPMQNNDNGSIFTDPVIVYPQPIFDLQEIDVKQYAQLEDYNLELLDVKRLHEKGYYGQNVKVAVLDTGVADHQDLKDLDRNNGRDYTNSRYGSSDVNGHGTHCAGAVSADNNELGTLGMAPQAVIIPYKTLSDQGSGLDTWSARAHDEATRANVDITTNSYGGSGRMPATNQACQTYIAKGGICIFAAGNGGRGSVDYPGAEPWAISVGAVDSVGRIANFSSENRQVDVYAGGVQVLSLLPGNRIGKMSGTSMACPSMAGALACAISGLKAEGIKIPSQSEILECMQNYVKPVQGGLGAGIFQAFKFYEYWKAKNKPTLPVDPVEPPSGKVISMQALTEQLKAAGIEAIKL